MTLSDFLKDNNIKLSRPNKSRLGDKLSKKFKLKKEYVKEGGYFVIDYPDEFLDNSITQNFIISILKTF